ncbi:regulator of telomere elongation helicase 1-like isoform X1 [Brachyistius frenatus]|uniref:regulator of telomere elongation helicase 1-like isoform X1 n=1 Tax=Brachyistius frenatus TaxID=100188 RepID=UPI0037E9055C
MIPDDFCFPGFYQFVRPHHKKSFDARCEQLTGEGCGYKLDHSLSKEEKKAVLLQSAADVHPAVTPTCSQLNTQQLNRGGRHLNQQALKEPPAGSAPKTDVHSSFLTDVNAALGAEKSTRLFQAVRGYKKTENYESLVTTAVSLLTESDGNLPLLVKLGLFIRPQHQKQYGEMLDALMGRPVSTAEEDDAAGSEEQQTPASPSSSLKTQRKISSFFSSSQRR